MLRIRCEDSRWRGSRLSGAIGTLVKTPFRRDWKLVIDRVDRQLSQWVTGVAGDSAVTFSVPAGLPAGRGVALHLMELVDKPPPRGGRRPPLQILLRYLVSCWAESAEEAHRLLGELVFAAMENPEFEVDLTPVATEVWTAFGVAPRPSFFLCVPLRVERPAKPAPLVRAPLVIKSAPIANLDGVVIGPGDVPVMGARVELPGLQLSTRTDFRGRFHFRSIPAEPALSLRVKVKDQEIAVKARRPSDAKAPLLIRLPKVEV